MSLFNPRILDASIHDVAVNLSDSQKADVLLFALQLLPLEGCRTTMENAVHSLLQLPNLSPANVARTLLLRAKCRLAAGCHVSAQQELLPVLIMDPENQDAKAIIQAQQLCPETLLEEPDRTPPFSVEVWREIALFLPRCDLKSLLFVSNALSYIARELLFCDIALHFHAIESGDIQSTQGASADQEVNTWHLKRSADILARILLDARFAGHIKSLSIFAASSDVVQASAFQVGIVMNTLPRLLNLHKVLFSGNAELVTCMLQTVHLYNPRLQYLSLIVTDHSARVEVPPFKHLVHLTISSHDGTNVRAYIHACLAKSRDSLRSLCIDNPRWRFPAESLSVQHLAYIEFQGCFSADTKVFSEILANGYQLKSLILSGSLESTPSALFRQHHKALPFLRHFALEIRTISRHITDRDLCPAISDFLRERTQLQTCRLHIPSREPHRIGFDASVWGVLPALSRLTNLMITYPSNLPPELAGWLVPRAVRALTLDLSHVAAPDLNVFVNQLRKGIPPQLRYVGIVGKSMPVVSIVERGFPNVRVACIDDRTWTVTRVGETVEVEEWPQRRVKYYSADWLESLGCADAIWRIGHPDYT